MSELRRLVQTYCKLFESGRFSKRDQLALQKAFQDMKLEANKDVLDTKIEPLMEAVKDRYYENFLDEGFEYTDLGMAIAALEKGAERLSVENTELRAQVARARVMMTASQEYAMSNPMHLHSAEGGYDGNLPGYRCSCGGHWLNVNGRMVHGNP